MWPKQSARPNHQAWPAYRRRRATRITRGMVRSWRGSGTVAALRLYHRGMNNQELETLVLSTVDRILNGRRAEDSRIECKGSWPDPKKARQLAGHANSARGEEIVWIIGIDETAGEFTSPVMPDLADWWSQMSARFDDHVVPGIRELNVQVTDTASVTALLFSTDRAPYLIKASDGQSSFERDVPMRSGTGTRSAYRHELLRLLQPAAVPPPASLITASLSGYKAKDSSTRFHLNIQVYIDQRPDEIVVLPYHQSMCQIVDAREELVENKTRTVLFNLSPGSTDGVFAKVGVQARSDGFVVAGGAVVQLFGITDLKNKYSDFSDVQEFEIIVEVGVAGAERSIEIVKTLNFQTLRSPTEQQQLFGSWTFPPPMSSARKSGVQYWKSLHPRK